MVIRKLDLDKDNLINEIARKDIWKTCLLLLRKRLSEDLDDLLKGGKLTRLIIWDAKRG